MGRAGGGADRSQSNVTAEEEQDAKESAMVAEAVKNLAEHFDSVTILCSRHEGSRGTRTIAKGSGNWHTQHGIVSEWLINREQTIRLEAKL